MKLKALLWTTIISIAFISCSGGGDEGNAKISFESSEYQATFYTPGETDPMNINFDTSEGDTDINVSPETHHSIYFNGFNGRVEWTEELPLGENTVTVIAVTESGEATTTITINNTFQGAFDGGYNFTPGSQTITSIDYSLTFNNDGTVDIYDGGNAGTGIWEMSEDNAIELIYSYEIAPTTFYTFSGALFYDENEAYIDGFFYRGSEVVPGDERGYFRVDFQ